MVGLFVLWRGASGREEGQVYQAVLGGNGGCLNTLQAAAGSALHRALRLLHCLRQSVRVELPSRQSRRTAEDQVDERAQVALGLRRDHQPMPLAAHSRPELPHQFRRDRAQVLLHPLRQVPPGAAVEEGSQIRPLRAERRPPGVDLLDHLPALGGLLGGVGVME